MKNMRVSMKLMVSFLIVAAMAAIVGVVGIFGLSTLKEKDSELYYSNVRAISAMADFREAYQTERTLLRTMILAVGDPAAVRKAADDFAGPEQTIRNAMAAYEQTIEDESQETKYFEAKNAYLGDYATAKQEMINAALAGDAALAYQRLLASGPVVAPIVGGLQSSATVNNGWASETVAENTQLANLLTIVQAAVLLFAIAIAVFFAFYISNLISKPVTFMKNVLHMMGIEGIVDFSDEEYRQAEQFATAQDEVGESIKMLIQTGRHLEEVGKSLETVASGDLTAEVVLLSDRDTIGRALKKMMDNLNNMFGDIRTASDQVSSGAGQVSQGAQELASGSSQQAANIEELSASLAELQEKTDNNAKASNNAREANNKTSGKLEDSIRSMGQMLEAMKSIDESSSNITKVIKVIDDIAFQTNILALNAAVEAARAGQHGKGFAVVADEVRNLAAKSAEAAKETSSLIEGSTERVKEGNEIVSKTNANLEEAVESARESTRLIEQVAGASIGQAKSITEINQGMEQISTVVQANSATAEQSAAASEEMSAQAIVMNDIVAKFKIRQQSPGRLAYSSSVGTSSQQAQNYGQFDSPGRALSGGKY